MVAERSTVIALAHASGLHKETHKSGLQVGKAIAGAAGGNVRDTL